MNSISSYTLLHQVSLPSFVFNILLLECINMLKHTHMLLGRKFFSFFVSSLLPTTLSFVFLGWLCSAFSEPASFHLLFDPQQSGFYKYHLILTASDIIANSTFLIIHDFSALDTLDLEIHLLAFVTVLPDFLPVFLITLSHLHYPILYLPLQCCILDFILSSLLFPLHVIHHNIDKA